MRPRHSEEKTEMQAPERPERPEWLDAWEAIDDDAVTALAYALHGYGVDAIAARDALHALSGEWELVRAGTGRASPVEGSGGHEPFGEASTPIDPADIRPGDVVRISRDVEVRSVIVSDFAPGGLLITDVKANDYNSAGATLHLVHRPDPDAEVIEALILSASTDSSGEPDYGRTTPEKILSRLRERGFDVVKRAES